MKHARTRAVAPTVRPSMTAPMSDPRLRFMTAGPEGGEGTAGGDPAGNDPAPAGDPAPDDKTHEDPPADDDEQGSTSDDPKLKAARDEAAQNRIKARDAAAEKDQLIQQMGKALGLITDDDKGEGPDAEALARSVADEQAKAVTASRELAVYKAATKAGANPDALLDSRSFLASIEDVDHTDPKAVTAAIEAAVKANTNLASRQVHGASTADTASGPGGGSAPKGDMSLAEAVAGHYNR